MKNETPKRTTPAKGGPNVSDVKLPISSLGNSLLLPTNTFSGDSELAIQTSEMQPSESKVVHLSISSHVVVQLGAELVTDVEQALLELAKNAYDADSENCEIVIEPNWYVEPTDPVYDRLFPGRENSGRVAEKVGRVQVIDDGGGLSQKAVESGWLRISASIKRPASGIKKEVTFKGRTPVGDKGLGRLATMKIGTVLRMKTAVAGESARRTVMFSWADFTPERTLEEVPVEQSLEAEGTGSAGTTIEVIGLKERSSWEDEKRVERKLVPKLSSLVSPFLENAGFALVVQHEKKRFELSTLSQEVLNLAAVRYQFAWNGRTLSRRTLIADSLFRGAAGDEYAKNFDLVFGNPSNRKKFLEFLCGAKYLGNRGCRAAVDAPWFLELDESEEFDTFPTNKAFPGAGNPGPFTAEINNFSFTHATKEQLHVAGLSAAAVQEMASLAIFRDGFRVRGDRDWLQLSGSGTKGGSFYELKPNNAVGFFSVSNHNNPGLIEKSDREGFVDNSEYRGFMVLSTNCRDYANGILEVVKRAFNKFVASLAADVNIEPTPTELLRKISDATNPSKPHLVQVQTTINKAIDQIRSGVPGGMPGQFDGVVGELEVVKNAINRQLQDAHVASTALESLQGDQAEVNLRLVEAAAVGLSARALAHELHQYIRQIKEGVSVLDERTKAMRDPEVKSAIRLLFSTVRELAKTISAIDPLLPGGRSIKENVRLNEFLEKFTEGRQPRAAAANVDLSFVGGELPESFSLRFNRTRLLQIVENLFNNSLYWLNRGPLPEKGRREVLITGTDTGFIWSDSGPGIKPSIEGALFDPFVSDKPSSESQGLGLHIVNTFLTLERCSIRLMPDRNSLGRRYKFLIDLSNASAGPQSSLLN